MRYDRERAVAYAHKWAFGRNPRYYDFSGQGGDCTNFISQCLYAGCGVMNYTADIGWFYISPAKRSASWSGVPYLYNFLTANSGPGPYGYEAPLREARPGDVIQLSYKAGSYAHSLMIVACSSDPAPDNILIATHTINSDNRSLASYSYLAHRLIHIDGCRK